MSGDALMDALRRHEGVWEGTYRHLDLDGHEIDRHGSRVECLFPGDGDVVYVQRNTFTWPDGRVERLAFDGRRDGERIVWDNERFRGHAWVAGGDVILLELGRRDEPDTTFTEIIVLKDGAEKRMRTWHWFRRGVPIRRTLCDERRVQ
ncbi:MAG: hypothetical protein AAFX58_01045 [Pseudomonadota bacterium]